MEQVLASARPSTVATTRGAVEYAETGDGPALLALHGAMGGWDQAAILARACGLSGHRVIALSRPGYLGTPLASGRSLDDQADLYAATLDALRLRRAAVVAVSGGGPSAIRFALRHRDRCRALVLISTLGAPRRGLLPLTTYLALALGRRPWFAERMRRRAKDLESVARRAIRDARVRERTLADPEAGPLLRALVRSTGDRLAMRIEGTKLDVTHGRGPPPPLEDIRVPTLVIHGTEDRIVPFARHGAVLARRIPGAELLALDGGEHVALFTHLDLVRARVGAFLRA